ncbi:MAG: hypothetical protein ACK4NP_00365 [Parvularculaceae bacterium]
MTASDRTALARRLLRNALVVIAATAVFGFKAAERGPLAAPAPVAIAAH